MPGGGGGGIRVFVAGGGVGREGLGAGVPVLARALDAELRGVEWKMNRAERDTIS
jgi:hypothetical protein